MSEVTRKYQGKDVDMLTTCLVITENAIEIKSTLVAKRTTWADPFFPDLKQRIEEAFPNYLGIDNAKGMRQATQVVNAMFAEALDLIAEFKVQIEEDFKNTPIRRDEILNQLGITQHLPDVQNGDQEAFVELLMKFNDNMVSTLETEITDEGTDIATINAIKGFATTLNTANITQETLKGGRKTITAEALTEFNEIHSAVMSVARISRNFFKREPDMADKFSYNHIRSTLNATRPDTEPPPSQ